MENIKYCNVSQIVSIDVIYSMREEFICFCNYQKQTFWRQGVIEGFYKMGLFDTYLFITPEEIKDSQIFEVIDEILYRKPHLLIQTSNGQYYEEYFDTQNKLDIRLEEYKTILPTLIIKK